MLANAQLILGFFLLAIISLDFLLATIGASCGGYLSRLVGRGAFVAMRGLARLRDTRTVHRLCGPLTMTTVSAFWIVGVSLCWLLIFTAAPSAVLDKESATPVGPLQVYGFVGSLLSTVGASGAKAGSTGWDVLGVVAAVNGMIILTLAVSFVLSTTQTVVQGRQLCGMVWVLDPADPEQRTTFAKDIVALAASLHSAYFALFYSADDPDRRLPGTLVDLMRKARSNPEAFRTYRNALQGMPGLDLEGLEEDDAVIERIESWARRYQLARR